MGAIFAVFPGVRLGAAGRAKKRPRVTYELFITLRGPGWPAKSLVQRGFRLRPGGRAIPIPRSRDSDPTSRRFRSHERGLDRCGGAALAWCQ